MLLLITLCLVSLLVSPLVHGSPHPGSGITNKYDVIVFAATPAGFAAALAAKANGADSVLLLEPSAHVGGMATGGIGLRDCDHDDIRINNSTQYQWGMRNAAFYGEDAPVWQPDNWRGEQTFLEMLDEAGVELRLNTTFVEGSAGIRTTVDVSGFRRVTGIKLESGELLECKYVIDASYEGEVMTSSGYVTYTFGREPRDEYNESFAGVTRSSLAQFQYSIDPYYHARGNKLDANTTLLPWIQSDPDPRMKIGSADDNLMAYTFRPCLTRNESNLVPFTKPPGYDPYDFELPRRYLLSQLENGEDPSLPWSNLGYRSYPNDKAEKYDACCGYSPVGIDAVGLAVGYANANRAKRRAIYEEHRYYVQGLMWFWATDLAVPESVRNEINSAGLCKDEWPENGHFPPQLYVREAARLVGDKVYTQGDRVPSNESHGCSGDSIAIGSWAFDIHDMERVAVKNEEGDYKVYNEGLTSYDNGGVCFFELPYYILLPQKREMVNLAVPNCPSVSHVAFSAIREEPTLWQMGQAAGTAAGLALQQGGVALHDVRVPDIQEALMDQDAFVHWPPRVNCDVKPNTSDLSEALRHQEPNPNML